MNDRWSVDFRVTRLCEPISILSSKPNCISVKTLNRATLWRSDRHLHVLFGNAVEVEQGSQVSSSRRSPAAGETGHP